MSRLFRTFMALERMRAMRARFEAAPKDIVEKLDAVAVRELLADYEHLQVVAEASRVRVCGVPSCQRCGRLGAALNALDARRQAP